MALYSLWPYIVMALYIQVKPTDSVAKIKKVVKRKTGIRPKEQVLKDKDDRPLNDNSKPIKTYGVKDGDTLTLSKAFVVYVKPKGKKKVPIEGLKPDDTVKALKAKIEKQIGIARKKQLLTDKDKRPLSKDGRPIAR